MTLRKGEITRGRLHRHWPHHVVLSADKVRGVKNSEMAWSFAGTLSAAPRLYAVRNDGGDLVVFCFAKPEDADAFCQRFEREIAGDAAAASRKEHYLHRNVMNSRLATRSRYPVRLGISFPTSVERTS
jgi:hypothetical protein